MLNLYSDPDGKRIFDKSNPSTAMDSFTKHHSTTSYTQSRPNREKATQDAEEALKQKDKKISELEKELALIKVRNNNHNVSKTIYLTSNLCEVGGWHS